jgi:NADPH:quinone reductase-like Zn-dependent oxidoreductase
MMKAIVYEKYGSPDVLELKEIDRPVVKDDQVLVKVHAGSVNPLDWHRMRGQPYFMRTSEGLGKPKNTGLGADVAGVVEEVGRNVTQVQPGDEVFGMSMRTLADYVAVSDEGVVP